MRNQSRPKFLNLLILGPKMPINAKVSILHRISGILLFFGIPIMLFILQQSLTSASFYAALFEVITNPIMRLVYFILGTGFIYHAISGLRFLFIEMHVGVDIKKSQASARVVLLVTIILAALLGWSLC